MTHSRCLFDSKAGCEGDQENGGPAFREVAYKYDGSRPTLANMFTFNDLLSKTIDVQGFSHQSRQKLDDCHQQMPNKPIFMSECCSCNTMRDEDTGCESSDGGSTCTQKSFNADCVQSQVIKFYMPQTFFTLPCLSDQCIQWGCICRGHHGLDPI